MTFNQPVWPVTRSQRSILDYSELNLTAWNALSLSGDMRKCQTSVPSTTTDLEKQAP